jgi:hypothetical protein
MVMKPAKKISPDEYILSVLSPRERLDAALSLAREAFKRRVLKPVDVQEAVKKVRKKAYAERQKKNPSRR